MKNWSKMNKNIIIFLFTISHAIYTSQGFDAYDKRNLGKELSRDQVTHCAVLFECRSLRTDIAQSVENTEKAREYFNNRPPRVQEALINQHQESMSHIWLIPGQEARTTSGKLVTILYTFADPEEYSLLR